MRSIVGLSVVAIIGAVVGCGSKDDNAAKTDAGAGTGGSSQAGQGGGGSGGQDGGGAGGAGGSGGTAEDLCQGIPTTGQCVGTTQIQTCLVSSEADAAPQTKTTDCEPLTECKMVNGSAQCVMTGDCLPGQTACKTTSTLQSCDATGHWAETACGADACISQPGLGAQCLAFAPSSGIFMKGVLQYEYRGPNDATNPTDYSDPVDVTGGVDFFVTVFDDSELIGMDITKVDDGGTNPDGSFRVELDRQPTDKTFIYFWPMLFDAAGNAPIIAVAHAKDNSAMSQESDKYWSWGFDPQCGAPTDCSQTEIDIGNQVIAETDGSGAANVYQWIDYGYWRMKIMLGTDGSTPVNQGVTPLSVGIFWQGGADTDTPPGIKYDCGNCFVPPGGGGSRVTYDVANSLDDHFDSSLNISGLEPGYRSHWARSTLSHEFGHWAMQSFSRSPGEGGQHFVDSPSIPGLAYSEAYATFSGQTNVSGGDNAAGTPVYFTVQYGNGFWVNIGQAKWSEGDLERPNPNGPLDQDINENIISSMMWSLWANAPTTAMDPQNLGDAPIFSTMRTDRILSGNVDRGYHTVDFMDYLDAMKCNNLADDTQITAVVDGIGYPWKAGDATCQ